MSLVLPDPPHIRPQKRSGRFPVPLGEVEQIVLVMPGSWRCRSAAVYARYRSPLYEATLADSIRVLGEDHAATLTSRNNLAYAYRAAGDLGRAIPLFQVTLADRRRVLGEDHPLTQAARGNLRGVTG
jgi:hypothetical protein